MYDQIAANKRRTWVLMSLFTIIIVLIGWVWGEWIGNAQLGIGVSAIIAVVMTLFGYFRGDKVALFASGAKPIKKQDYPELYRLVENLAIASGIPTPKVYVMKDPSANAFATGRKPETASIAVTTGLLQLMNRQELEGVLAHEMSHIKNYDIRVMTIVVILVGVILLLSDALMRTFFFSDRDSAKGNGALVLIGIVLAILSPIFAQLIKLAISRKREYLADASGAMITRHPDALASALSKIAKEDRPLKKANHATAHLFLANPFDPHVTKKFERLFSTHPPIEQRIAKLRQMT